MTNKLPLILIPGLLCDATLWKHQINALKSIADCQVSDTSQSDRIESIASQLLSIAPPQFAMAGLSMGGYVALEIMRQAPQRVIKLCLLNTSARPDTPEQAERRRLLLAMSQKGQFKGVTPRLLPLLLHPDHLKNQELADSVMAMAERVGRNAFHNQQTAILNRIDSRPFLKGIVCPTQIIVGRQDVITPIEIVRELADMIKDARFNIIEDCGHLSSLEQPGEISAIMASWLRS